MGFSLNPVNLNYKKWRYVPSETVTLDPKHSPKSSITMGPLAPWLSVIRGLGFDYKVTIKSNAADSLSIGLHKHRVYLYYKFSVGPIKKTQEEWFDVNLYVSNTIRLTINPSFASFSYTIGASVPGKKFLSLQSENSWSIVKNQSWITLNKSAGTGSATLELGVDPSGLSSGAYNGTLLVDDGYDQKTVSVSLVVQGENTADEFLIVSPDNLEFVEAYQEAPVGNKKLVVESSEDFILAANVAWLGFSSTSWTAGNRSILVNTQDTESLGFGIHQGTITVTSSYSTLTVQVLLTINQSVLEGVASNGFYYADDRNKISFSNNQSNTELVLNFLTKSGDKEYSYPKTISFFRGVANSILGQEAKNLIAPADVLTNISTRGLVPVQALDMTIAVYDKVRNSTQQTLRSTLSGVRVLTGKTPRVSNWLSNIPNEITAPESAVILFSFRALDRPEQIIVSGSANTTVNIPVLEGDIYSCMVDLSDFELVGGDVVNVRCGGYTVKVNILPREPEHVKIAWLNQWSCPEIFTCSGNLEIENQTEQTVAKYAKEGQEHSKVVDVDTPQAYKVYTGFIYSRPEVEWLHSILDAKKIWLQVNGEWVEVLRDFKSLPFYETRNFLDSYLLKFDKALV